MTKQNLSALFYGAALLGGFLWLAQSKKFDPIKGLAIILILAPAAGYLGYAMGYGENSDLELGLPNPLFGGSPVFIDT